MIQEKSKINILEKIVLSHSVIELRSDGIVQFIANDNIAFTIKETMEAVEAIGKLSAGKEVCVLKIAGVGTSVDTDSRHYIAHGRGARYSIAEAIVIQSKFQKIIGNFYITVEKPQKTTRLFIDRTSAIEWLYSLLK
jgi:hypothetical protein